MREIYKSTYAKDLIKYAQNTYKSELEFLWKNSPCAILRKVKSKKWFALFAKINRQKLGLSANEEVELLVIKLEPDDILALVDNQNFSKPIIWTKALHKYYFR